MTVNKLVNKLEWLIKEVRKLNQDSIPVGKLEEYIQEYKNEFPENNKNNGGKYAKDSVIDFTINVD
jgi:hypothetical protein